MLNWNVTRLTELNIPILVSRAEHDPKDCSDASTQEGGNLHAKLTLCVSARVMLTENLWTEQGLVNGSLGTVYDISWDAGKDPQTQSPDHVLVQCDQYSGPSIINNTQIRPVVPVFKADHKFTRGNKVCRRIQFHLTMVYAVTVHKSQGLTVDKAVLNIAEKDFAPGLSYVAVSRVRTLRGILFQEPFDYRKRFATDTEPDAQIQRKTDAIRRHTQEL